ncbi:hypothetical protein G7072_17850 [Nocardioides sp. HDW12B]|uniref:hypothetical protein n=1 Tax=Nocardioides sp. HDW12B TaxID=2714939 RepID=UPI00140B5E7F|nr:hypothetical protein [Nocardioides sp. HDW12B]QIK67957.1 hypothetical protein G7072_17850 [Nocardioides sp. HDW12B]
MRSSRRTLAPSPRAATSLGVLGLVVALSACSGSTEPGPDRVEEPARPCSQGDPVLSAVDLEPVARDDGGPLLHATLWARHRPGHPICVSLEVGHADVGAEVVEAEVTASVDGRTRTSRGGEISDLAPLRLDADRCVVLRATVALEGRSGLHEHRAASRVGRDCPR